MRSDSAVLDALRGAGAKEDPIAAWKIDQLESRLSTQSQLYERLRSRLQELELVVSKLTE